MIEKVTGGKVLPAEVLDQILARTDGVPLFIEELTKSVSSPACSWTGTAATRLIGLYRHWRSRRPCRTAHGPIGSAGAGRKWLRLRQ